VKGPGRKQMDNGIFPAHLNAVAMNHSTGLHKVTSIDELKDLVAKTYHMFRDKFVEEAHEHPSYQAYRLVYAVFNRILVITPILGSILSHEKRVLFLRGCISLKNRSYCPLLRDSTSPFKSTCLLIRLK
jgi:hypothetical protein